MGWQVDAKSRRTATFTPGHLARDLIREVRWRWRDRTNRPRGDVRHHQDDPPRWPYHQVTHAL